MQRQCCSLWSNSNNLVVEESQGSIEKCVCARINLEKLQLREVALIAARVEGHEAISVNEGVCTDDEVGEQPLRFLCYSAASTGRIFRVPAASFQPCLR